MSRQGYSEHETFWSDFRMYFSMLRQGLLGGLLLQIVVLMLLIANMDTNVYIFGTNEKLSPWITIKYNSNWFGHFDSYPMTVDKQLVPYAKGWPKLPLKIYCQMADYVTNGAYAEQQKYLANGLYYSFLSYLFSILYIFWFLHLSNLKNDETFIRGAQMISIRSMNRLLSRKAKENPLSCLKVGETILPFEMESKHTLILGTAGSGKGVLLNQLINQINVRKRSQKTGERCIFYDLKGEFVSKQFEEGDHVFSPFDSRSLRWNIFNEIETLPDYDVMAKSLFISPDTKDAYWYNCASDIFRTGLIYLKMRETTTNLDLWHFFSQKLEDIKACFETLPLAEQGALKHIDKSDSPASASIISILQERIHFFRYLTDLNGDFSFRKFIRDQKAGGPQPNLFILNIEQYSTIFKPLMTLCIDTMIRETLSFPDDLNRRIWFIIDELGTLYRMDSIIKLETVGRSKGGCLICANQDLGRIEEMYGKANLKSFFNNFNTNFTFRIREPETAEFLSKAIGDQQVLKTSHSRQMAPTDIGDRKSESEQEKTERLLLPVEFQSLRDLEAIINIAGFGISKISVPPIFYPEKYSNFEMRIFDEIGTFRTNANPPLAPRPDAPDFSEV